MLEDDKEINELSNADTIKSELIMRTNNLDTYIEENSSRNIEYMKFEIMERMKYYLNEFIKMEETARNLQDDYNSDSKIKKLEQEVE